MTSMLEHALRYAIAGISVFPLKPGSKEAALLGSFHQATTDLHIVDRWWNKDPQYNIGIACSKAAGRSALDIDYDGLSKEYIERLQKLLLEIPSELRVLTYSGNEHRYFSYTEDFQHSTKFCEGLQLRSNGYMVAPPSVVEGKPYSWLAFDPNPRPFPTEFFRKTFPAQKKTRFRLPERILEGFRDVSLFKYACQLRKSGCTEPEIKIILTVINDSRGEPPMSAEDIDRIVQSACKFQRGEIDEQLLSSYRGEPIPESVI